MAWQQISMRLDAGQSDAVEAILRLAGAASVSVSDAGNDPLYEPPPGTTPTWPQVRLTALFDTTFDLGRLARLLPSSVDAASISIDTVAERDWIHAWRESITLLTFGNRLEIVPAPNTASVPRAPRLALNMGLAFGTGRHPTTRMCLEWLAGADWSDATVLDFGCGSGILALAALRCGARYAWATDHDPQALTATRDNARSNGLEDALWIGKPDSLPAFDADVVMANILAGTLCELAALLAARQGRGGRIVLSGVLESQSSAVLDAYSPYYQDFQATELDGWIMQSGIRTDKIVGAVRRA
jgi:ribosomal protein L11 methyltransferase